MLKIMSIRLLHYNVHLIAANVIALMIKMHILSVTNHYLFWKVLKY